MGTHCPYRGRSFSRYEYELLTGIYIYNWVRASVTVFDAFHASIQPKLTFCVLVCIRVFTLAIYVCVPRLCRMGEPSRLLCLAFDIRAIPAVWKACGYSRYSYVAGGAALVYDEILTVV